MSGPLHSALERPWCDRAILHVDIDAFFAAVEQLDDPSLVGVPVIVGGSPDGRGVVSTASYEARAFGVRSAMPSARAAALCPHAVWRRPRFERYRELSDAVFAILRDCSPLVQPVSVDEAFLDVTPGRFSREDPVAVARTIRERVSRLGLTVSVGVATSKTVAKIASDHEKPDGLTVVRPGHEAAFLAPLPIRAMSGVGPRTAERLEQLGLKTLGDIAALEEPVARQALGSGGPALVERARGHDPRPVSERAAVKSVSNERTFPADLYDSHDVTQAVDRLAEKVSGRLRAKGLTGRTVSVKVRFSDFSTRVAQTTFESPTADGTLIGSTARSLVESVLSRGVGVRLLGVGVSGFEPRGVQLQIGEQDPCEADSPRPDIGRSIDEVRRRFGPDAIRFGRDVRPPG